MQPQAKERQSRKKPGAARRDASLGPSRGHTVLPAPAPGTSSLQNCKTAHFHCLKPLGLWYFAQKPQKIKYSIQRPATEPWGSAPTCSYHIIGQLRMGVNFVLEQIIIINARTLHPGAHRSPEPGRVASLGSIPACTSQVGGPSVTSTRFTFPPFSRPARSPPPGAAAPVQVGAELAILPAPWSGGATDFQLCDRTTRQVESGTIGPGAPKHILGN